MITFLEGRIEEKQPARVVLNVGGVGYEVLIPLGTYDRLPAEGAVCRLLIYHHFTESDQRLFGFSSEEEREMFVRLLGVSGIGPKLAVSALSGLSVRELKAALLQGDVKRISSISGIGKKTAERIIVELRDKFSPGEAFETFAGREKGESDPRLRDAALALAALGYKPEEAGKMVAAVSKKISPQSTVEEIVRLALTR